MSDTDSTDSPDPRDLLALVELSSQLIASIDARGCIRRVNAAAGPLLGHAPVDLVGRNMAELLPPGVRLDDLGPADSSAWVPLRLRHRDGHWKSFELRLRPAAEPAAGVLLCARDLGPHDEAGDSLRAALDEARRLYDEAGCGYHSLAADGRFLRINDTELKWLGYRREEVVGRMNFRELLTPLGLLIFERQLPEFQRRGSVQDLEFELVRKDGSLLPALISATAIKDAEGRYLGCRSTVYDISARRQAEQILKRVNRALRVLSATNSAVIHARDETALLQRICEAIVRRGGYRMAWVGLAGQDPARTVLPVAQAGFAEGYLEQARIGWADDDRGRGPTGTAIRSGTAQVNQDFLRNPAVAPWRESALRHGYQSSIALPLKAGGAVFGALTIYAPEPDAFDMRELALLGELAEDLAFGVATLRARAEHEQAQLAIEHLAFHDPLTGLANRARLLDRLGSMLASPTGAATLALLTIELEGFHDIQAGVGVRLADALLVQVGERLRQLAPEGAVLARIGAESFALLLPQAGADQARDQAAKIAAALAPPFLQAGMPLTVGLRVGAAITPEHGDTAELLLVRSGSALRQARQQHLDYQLYAGDTTLENPQRLTLISDLRAGIAAGQLVPHFQPKIEVTTGKVAGGEVLLRWQHPERGLLPPGDFVPLAEQTGLIRPLTQALLEAVLQQLVQWRESGFELPLAVNVSARNFADPEFVDRTLALLDSRQVPARLLQLEITESALMDDPARRLGQLERVRAAGISIAIDDFGTGYSSLSYLATLPVDTLKIDRAFVSTMLDAPRIRSIVGGTISLARALNMKTVAEGVETREQARALIDAGCEQLQGFLFSPGIPAEAFRRWAEAFRLADHGLEAASVSAPPAGSVRS